MKKFFTLLAMLALMGCAPRRVQAQYIGNVGLQTVNSKPFTNTACTGSPQTASVPNIGQTAHYALLLGGGTITNLTMKFLGSNDGTNFFDISETATVDTSANASIVASGYYSVVQVSITCNVTGTFSVFYSGLSATPSQPYGSFLTTQTVKGLAFGAAANANFTSQTVRSPFANSSGTLYFQYTAGGPAGSTLAVKCSNDQFLSLTFTVPAVPLVATGAVLQTFPIPPSSCPFFNVTYTSGGASATSFTLLYVFNEPGSQAPTGTYTHVTTTTATAAKATAGFLHTLNVNTAAAGTISIFDLPTASCTGTPATNTVAVITIPAATNGLPPFIYDVNLLQGICVKASVAMDYTVSSN